jgi:hypothetical protein
LKGVNQPTKPSNKARQFPKNARTIILNQKNLPLLRTKLLIFSLTDVGAALTLHTNSLVVQTSNTKDKKNTANPRLRR